MSQQAGVGPAGRSEPGVEAPPMAERSVTTEHTLELGGGTIRYSATAGLVNLQAADGRVRAQFFCVAYTRLDGRQPATRPLTFAFNGGPGSSAAWLHMGCLGPRRIALGGSGSAAPGPPLLANQHTILEFSDLVLIDPVSTGWSRAVPAGAAGEFHGLAEDTESIGDLIRLLTGRLNRWSSPKYLAGESYGTVRAAAVGGYLQERHGLYLDGIVLISAVLMAITTRPARGNDLPYALYLPTYAATAWYHGALSRNPRSLEKLLPEVEEYALTVYLPLLFRYGMVRQAEIAAAAGALARYTGLDEEYLLRSDLRVTPQRFFKELLRGRRRTVGRLDARFLGIDPDAAGEEASYDPAYAVIQGPYTAAVNAYLREDLGFASDSVYEVLRGEAVKPWRWGSAGENQYVEVASALVRAMAINPGLRVFLAGGWYDLATPYFAAEWTLAQLRLEPDQRSRIVTRRYPAGHMMYVHEPSLARLGADLAAFFARPAPVPR